MRIVIVVSPRRRAFCASCGARWLEEEQAVTLASREASMQAHPSYRKTS